MTWGAIPVFVTLCLCPVTAGLPVTSAATLTVTNANDSGPGSLRQAIADALPGDEILFDPVLDGHPIVLTSGQLVIGTSLRITGRGPEKTIIDGNDRSRVFFSWPPDIAISGTTIRSGSADRGGGIYGFTNTSVNLDNCKIVGNSAGYGGGIYGSFVRLHDCIVSGNRAAVGGGVYARRGTLTMSNSTVTGNRAGLQGFELGELEELGDQLSETLAVLQGPI